jgi:hypothetical protein
LLFSFPIRRLATTRLACLAFFACAVVPLACASRAGTGPALDPRFVAVHNTLSAIGMAQVGPIQEGTLVQGHESRASLPLSAGCFTVVAMGGEGIQDLDATLVDGHGVAIAHDVTNEPQAVLHPCLESADTYVLVVRAASGGGRWVAATWAGGAGGASPVASAPLANGPAEANGTCAAPIALAPGSVTGSTSHGARENAGSCGSNESRELGRELVYELDVTQRERVTIEVEAHFDSVLYIRKDDCAEPNAEVDCNDDGPDRTHSRIDHVLEPGKYFVFVDGYAHEAGIFKMTVTASEVLALADVCRRAPVLPDGPVQLASTAGGTDGVQASCGGGAEGADSPWQMQLSSRSRVRIVEQGTDMSPVLHVRRSCVDAQSEVACGESGAHAGDAAVTGVFDPGKYVVFADAHEREGEGRYAIRLETAPLAGSGAPSDGCGDAARLPSGDSGSVEGDTFSARDDVAGSCGGAGAADVVYRLDVPRRARLTAELDGEESAHVLILWRRCGDRSAEVACARSIDEIVLPGTYYVGVDGAAPDAFGRFTLQWDLHEVAGQAGACATAPVLVDGRSIDSTTAGAADNFDVSCAGHPNVVGPSGTGPDRVYKLVLPTRSDVKLTLKAGTFDGALALRKSCSDTPGGSPAELACDADADVGRRTTIERTLEAGTYWVVVDGDSAKDQGTFTLDYRLSR